MTFQVVHVMSDIGLDTTVEINLDRAKVFAYQAVISPQSGVTSMENRFNQTLVHTPISAFSSIRYTLTMVPPVGV